VLITGAAGQARASLAAVRALGTAGYEVTVTEDEPRSLAGASRYCSRRVSVPRAGTAGYAEAVRAELASRQYLLTFPASDAALIDLGDPAAQLVDKAHLAQRARTAGMPTLLTTRYESGEELLGDTELTFPLVVKPAEKKTAAFAEAVRIDDRAGLARISQQIDTAVVVQPFLDCPLDAVAGVMWDGEIVASVHQRTLRTWPVGCGVSSAAMTVEPDTSREAKIGSLLQCHRGVFEVQFLAEYLIDCNPRIYGSLPLAVAAGANLPALACRCAAGEPPRSIVRARVGARYRWTEGDLRNLWHTSRAGELAFSEFVSALRPVRRTVHSVESLRDPLPALARLGYVLKTRRQ
jgi:predicted ATP-grasp superfamily ATP-dependent carboligase